MKVLLDNNIPVQVAKLLPSHEVKTARSMGWAKLVNGELLKRAEEAGFDCLLTGDQNLPYQNNLVGRKIAVVVVNTIKPDVLATQINLVIEALSRARAGDYLKVALALPPLRRRPYPAPER